MCYLRLVDTLSYDNPFKRMVRLETLVKMRDFEMEDEGRD